MDVDATLWATITGSSLSLWGVMAASAKLAVYLTSFLAAGLMLVLVALPICDHKLRRSLFITAAIAIVLALLTSAWRVMVQAGRLMDDIASMIDPEIIAISLEGPLGSSTLVRLLASILLLIAIIVPRARVIGSLSGAAAMALSFGMTGHATRDPQWALMGLITIHLLAVSFWFGALLPLYRLSAPGADHQEAARLSHRFGRQATVIVPILIAVGAGFAFLLLGSPQALITTAYGQMLLVKLAIVGVVLAIAALNKLKLVPALEAGTPGADQRFRTSLKWETLVFLSIFATTALLTTTFTVPTL